MKIKIGYYEVSISAKCEGSARANKSDTMALLNFLSICCSETANKYSENGWTVTSMRARQYGKDIFEALNNACYYDDLAETP